MLSDLNAAETSSTRILVVDDTPDNLAVLGELLAPHYQVLVANSGPRALQLAGMTPKPELILLDVMMPGMSGYEVFDILKSDPETADIPVIFVTSLASVEEEEHGLDVGAADYISKPVRPAIVLARVRSQLQLKRARDQLRKQNSFLEGEITRRLSDYTAAQDVSIHALARLAEKRDPETGNHLMRTREYVRCLAEGLRHHPRFSAFLTERNIQMLPKSAPLHDIGKVGIPDHILLKPGKLTPEEWEVMRTHAKMGSDAIEAAEHDALQSVEFMMLAKDIAHYHHEKWDGSGYPDGLAGDAIPIAARLMALADVFDALISRRVYKPPIAFDKARDIIIHGRGSHFDPDVVEAFTTAFEEFCAIAGHYSDSDEILRANEELVRTLAERKKDQ
ncbi:response regulator [Rhodocyclus tenuis]|uniref:Putative two-component system response regulator n=1 Tax=Rhodocyclus tenuis TaxID=1066 RepID=A0A840FY95_RHOTE|nr:two-component system response regulator [Rhodocyclus tenuis]MBB4247097.1 putative two-component system response regulator [Rhodocyclus tenuis]MBK1678806.1 two-component system response regulator [Rhodocyclus tenuis]